MSITNLVTRVTYDGDNVVVDFPITFDFNQDKALVKVFLIDEITEVETEQFETADFVFDVGPITKITMNSAPTDDEKIRIERRTPKNQQTNFVSPTDPAATELALDKLTRQVQEAGDDISELQAPTAAPTSSTSAIIPDWATAINYVEDQAVLFASRLYRALEDHLSNDFVMDLAANKWELIEIEGIAGPQGDAGADGADGADSVVAGPQGPVGAAGNDGVFSVIASQGTAEAGANNTEGMTPLRVKQAIDINVPPALLAKITGNENDISNILLQLGDLQSQVTALQAASGFTYGKFVGSQRLLNTQAVPVKLVAGEDLPNGSGDPLRRMSTGAESAKVMVQIKRITSTENRFVTFDLIMQLVAGVWHIGRAETDQLDETLDLDGVILSVVTTDVAGVKIGDVYYETDTMAGLNHDDESVIKWIGQEMPTNI